MAPLIVHLVAAQSDTGKTTVIEKLLPELKQRGLRVAALKYSIHHYTLDQPGKDSRRFARAGAEIAGFTTPDSFFLFGPGGKNSGTEAAALVLKDLDLILFEGGKNSDNLKIEVFRGAAGCKPLLAENTVAVVTDCHDLQLDVPVIALEDSPALADFIQGLLTGPPAEMSSLGKELTHFDRSGRPRMVDVSEKESTAREAYARGEIVMAPETLFRVRKGLMAKGDVLAVAQVAAIMAVKETGRLIPMAHPLGVSGVEVDFETVAGGEDTKVVIGVRVRLTGQTGVEMEALTGVSVAALTIYDMCKAVDRNMVIQNIHLIEKKGGRSGCYRREQN